MILKILLRCRWLRRKILSKLRSHHLWAKAKRAMSSNNTSCRYLFQLTTLASLQNKADTQRCFLGLIPNHTKTFGYQKCSRTKVQKTLRGKCLIRVWKRAKTCWVIIRLSKMLGQGMAKILGWEIFHLQVRRDSMMILNKSWKSWGWSHPLGATEGAHQWGFLPLWSRASTFRPAQPPSSTVPDAVARSHLTKQTSVWISKTTSRSPNPNLTKWSLSQLLRSRTNR